MDKICTRRTFVRKSVLTLLAGQLTRTGVAAPCSAPDPQEHEHDIPVVTSTPYEQWLMQPEFGRWQKKPLAVLKAESVRLPWRDAVIGGADPYIGMTSSGDIYATTASRPTLMKSGDGGRTWTSKELNLSPAFENGVGLEGLTTAVQNFGILRDNTFILCYQLKRTQYLIARSTDFGQTWQPSVRIDTSPFRFGGGSTHGFLLEMQDGTVLLPIDCYQDQDQLFPDKLMIYRSKDGGKSWGDRTQVSFWCSEPSLIRLHSGRLMIAVRYQRCEEGACVLPSDHPLMAEMEKEGYPKDIYTAYSDDEGASWKEWNRVTTGVFDAPGQLIQLSDERLILTYAHRTPDPPPCGTWAMVSRDEGRTWEKKRFILNSVCDRPFDFGYAASVVLKDNVILSLCGCRGTGWPDKPELNRESPGRIRAIRWKPD